MNRLFIRRSAPFFGLFGLLWVVYLLSLSTNNPQINSDCEISVKTCRFLFSGKVVTAEINPKPVPLEELIYLSLNVPKHWQVTRAYIQGINMYMGRIPVIFEEGVSRGAMVGETYLGACSEPNMRWQLVVEMKNALGETQRAYFSFTTEY